MVASKSRIFCPLSGVSSLVFAFKSFLFFLLSLSIFCNPLYSPITLSRLFVPVSIFPSNALINFLSLFFLIVSVIFLSTIVLSPCIEPIADVPPNNIALAILSPALSAGNAKPSAPVDVILDTGANGPAHSIYLPIVAPCINAFADASTPWSASLNASTAPNPAANCSPLGIRLRAWAALKPETYCAIVTGVAPSPS